MHQKVDGVLLVASVSIDLYTWPVKLPDVISYLGTNLNMISMPMVITEKPRTQRPPAPLRLVKMDVLTESNSLTVHSMTYEDLVKEWYVVKFTNGTWLNTTFDGIEYYINFTNYTYEVKIDKPAGLAGLSALGGASASTPSGMGIMGGLLALDPTGTFFRFTKILQIVNKLYFININYGKRLGALFMAISGFEVYDPDENRPQKVYNNLHYRGKLTAREITLDFYGYASWRKWLYFSSWIVKMMIVLLTKLNAKIGKIGIYFCHYANKVHLIIFNLVFIDFIWLAPRTLLHSRDLPVLNYYGSC